jgi:hypothetical protein
MKMLTRSQMIPSCFGFACLASLPMVIASVAAAEPVKVDAPTRSAALTYLESLDGKTKDYVAPSKLDGRFNLALYVNAKGRGPNAQRMWVLQRDPADGKLKLAMWDKKWWRSKTAKRKYKVEPGQEPPFSWLVSTGYRWPGNRKSGPTSLGVFAMDERKGRTQRGWHTRGMIHVMYIDYHYRSGRRSGIAFHGTTPGKYRRLGRIASHGCIRMHQGNALSLLKRMRGWDKVLTEGQRWGEVPRFWRRQKYSNRYGYVRDGSLLRPEVKVAEAAPVELDGGVKVSTDAVPPSNVLTKTGYRAVAVIFKD